MARFDVFEYKSQAVPLVLDVQADLFSDLNSCVVVPLVPERLGKAETAPKLKPVVKIKDQDYVLMTTDISAVTRKSLGDFIINIEADYRQEITEALDFLFQGF